jgi:hypothetical protein
MAPTGKAGQGRRGSDGKVTQGTARQARPVECGTNGEARFDLAGVVERDKIGRG